MGIRAVGETAKQVELAFLARFLNMVFEHLDSAFTKKVLSEFLERIGSSIIQGHKV